MGWHFITAIDQPIHRKAIKNRVHFCRGICCYNNIFISVYCSCIACKALHCLIRKACFSADDGHVFYFVAIHPLIHGAQQNHSTWMLLRGSGAIFNTAENLPASWIFHSRFHQNGNVQCSRVMIFIVQTNSICEVCVIHTKSFCFLVHQSNKGFFIARNIIYNCHGCICTGRQSHTI